MCLQILTEVNKPRPKWGPANTVDRGSRYKIPVMPDFEMEVGDPDIVKAPHDSNGVVSVESKDLTNGNKYAMDNKGYADHM